ncbi:MAG: beta-N-acetylhexosaminidase [Clostridia bacterium]|nr:beta-N-acetylhexosaminidase [Clostridia bacterium]
MKLYFENAKALAEGIALLEKDLDIELVQESEAALTVAVTEIERSTLTVTLDGSHATITYGGGAARFFRGLGTLMAWIRAGETQKTLTETPLFKTNGAMADMSRNAVMKVEMVKTMLRKMALMGMNMYMLYTEDTYEIEGHPYFGYMRGRYTKEEIRDIDAYARKLGIELITCIQMLGHLATHLQWSAAAPYKDTENVLLVGAEETYKLIEDMLNTIKECFSTRRLHVGMDETNGLGLGAYLKKNGYRNQQDIYFEHLTKVIELVRAHGFEPMMWSDFFFRLVGEHLPGYYDYDPRVQFTDEVKAKVPRGIQQVFWDYYRTSESFYAENIDKHYDVFGKDMLFAGGVWLWSGHAPLYSRSLRYTIPALEACRKKGVREVIATLWLNGGEGSLMLSLAGLAWYADYDYRGCYDEAGVKTCFENACVGVKYDDLMKCEPVEHPDGSVLPHTRALLYNDPLIGLVDRHYEGMDLGSYYRGVSEKMDCLTGELDVFAPAYDTIRKLSSLLENKADYGIRLKAAYDKKDKEALAALAGECDVIGEKLEALKQSHKASWMIYNKPFGWEVHDIRYGGLAARFQTVKERVLAYLAGEIETIEELEATRLRIDGKPDDAGRFDDMFSWRGYTTYATPHKIG